MKLIKDNIPNTITCLNLLSGVMAVIMAFSVDTPVRGTMLTGMQWAFIFIGCAAVFDFLDGAVARMLGAYSELGKELDSLSDLVSFGVAPSLVLYNYLSGGDGVAQWVPWVALFIPAMGALRLARFNIDTRQASSFIGLPIPANALLWIGWTDWMRLHGYPGDVVTSVIIVLGALLMVSNITMFSLKFKNFGWRENFRRYILIAAAVTFVATEGIPGLAWTVLFYLLMSLLSPRRAAAKR